MAEIRNIFVIAKRWHDRRYGNTYHSVEIRVNGNVIIVPFKYGYDGQWKQTAMEALRDNGYRTGDYHNFIYNVLDSNYTLTDVKRKGDL